MLCRIKYHITLNTKSDPKIKLYDDKIMKNIMT